MKIQYDELKDLVEQHLLDFIPQVNPLSQTLYDSMEYSLTGGGKRLRPVLLLASCQFAGGDPVKALPYACAMEYIHTYSLIHDDLPAMDDDDLRRGRPTNHIRFGADIATLAGDGLLNTAFELMFKDMFLYFDKPDLLKRRVSAAYRIAVGAGVQGMVAGQVSDVESDHGQNSSPEMLRHIHINKTAAMIMGAVSAGLELGGADQEMKDHLRKYAENLGLEFQVVDDILDVTGTAEQLGKDPHQDEANGKLTYVSLYGLDGAKKRASQLTQMALAELKDYGEEADFFRDLVVKLEKRTH
ncbi:polyprenyl synthetase family protein [Eubacterium sp. F2]|uniref:polyprenyl synthetase family protein n=1 Tax=Eubacterium sp. F2 TaxID=3381348 RepID=UPI0039080842